MIKERQTRGELASRRIDYSTFEQSDQVDIVAQELALFLRRGEFGAVKAFFVIQELEDIADLLENMSPQDALVGLRQLPLEDQAELFGDLKPSTQVTLADVMARGELATIMTAMSHDERADLYKALDPEARAAVLPGLAQAERDDLRRLASHAEGTAGAIMTSDYATLPPELTAPEALESLRRQAIDSETIYNAYVVDELHRLIGVVSLREILIAGTHETIESVMETDPVAISVYADQEECAHVIARYDLIALPIIDNEDRIVGIVTADDAFDVAEEEATEDMLRGSNIEPIAGSLSDARIPQLYRARIFWLVLLVFGNIFSGAGIAHFEEIIAGNLALLFFLPLLIASGGNAGAQSATLMVRAMATGDVHGSDWRRMLMRELVIGLLLGLTMALAVSGVGMVRAGSEVTAAVAMAMVLIVLVGVTVGVLLPFILSKVGFDPATASGPLVTSIADVLGVLIYFSIAGAVLGVG